MQAEKRIRIRSLVGMNFTLKEIKDLFTPDESENYRILQHEVSSLLDFLHDCNLDERLSPADEAITYAVSGYVAKSLISDCDDCKSFLSTGRMEVPEIDLGPDPNTDELESKEEFLRMITRGGLLKPSNELYTICCQAQAVFTRIIDTDDSKKLLISGTINPRKAYVEVLVKKLNECSKGLLSTKCLKNHTLESQVKKIGHIMFNLFSKNLVNEENSKIASSRKRVSTSKQKTRQSQKLKKLTSS